MFGEHWFSYSTSVLGLRFPVAALESALVDKLGKLLLNQLIDLGNGSL